MLMQQTTDLITAFSQQFDSSWWNYAQWLQRQWTHDGRPSPTAAAGSRKTSATSCHDDYLSGADARRRSEPMKQSAWDKSIFHLFRARALPSVCPAMRCPSVGQCPTGQPSRAAGGIELYVWPSRPPPSQQIYSRRRCRGGRRGVAVAATAQPAAAAAAASGRAKSHHALSRPTLTFALRCEVSSLCQDDATIVSRFVADFNNQ